MLWQATPEVMLDMWRVRFGNERVSYRFLYNEKQGGDPNDWTYVARLLCIRGTLKRVEQKYEGGIFYQLKE